MAQTMYNPIGKQEQNGKNGAIAKPKRKQVVINVELKYKPMALVEPSQGQHKFFHHHLSSSSLPIHYNIL